MNENGALVNLADKVLSLVAEAEQHSYERGLAEARAKITQLRDKPNGRSDPEYYNAIADVIAALDELQAPKRAAEDAE